MANIVPICGVRYHGRLADKMAELITPPYDVIDAAEQQRFYNKNDYNIIRLEYGENRPADDGQDNRYTRAEAFFTTWLQQNILVHEQKPSVYLYEQEFNGPEGRLTRSGFIAGVGVEDYNSGMILPHEETLSKAKADRLELLRHCHANFSPIFSLYDDPDLMVENIAATYTKNTPDLTFTDENGEVHRLWVVNAKDDLDKITGFFRDKKVYIADGHHRYETALHFHREMAAQGDPRFGYSLMTLVNLHDPGLIILPTHRMIRNVADFNARDLLYRLGRVFTVETEDLPGHNRAGLLGQRLQDINRIIDTTHAFLLYTGDNRLYRLTLPRQADNPAMQERFNAFSPAWRSLDVAVLQCLIMEDILGIDQEARASGHNLTYTRNEAGALDLVDSGEYQAVIYLNPTRVREVTEVAAAGDKMPQKSTYFFPKLVTGLVINDFTV
jgi:uncharacterized protein (DUF1015 family)